MKRRISLRHLLLAAVAMFVLIDVGYADPLEIMTGPGANIFTFRNAHPTAAATDFQVVLLSNPPPAIGGGFGGAPFPNTSLLMPGPGLRNSITYFTNPGGPGIPPGGLYTHSFPGWPVGTRFEVLFSYDIPGQPPFFMDPDIVVTTASTAQGETNPVPEPTTMLLLSTGLAGVAIKTRKTLKSRKSRQENNSPL